MEIGGRGDRRERRWEDRLRKTMGRRRGTQEEDIVEKDRYKAT